MLSPSAQARAAQMTAVAPGRGKSAPATAHASVHASSDAVTPPETTSRKGCTTVRLTHRPTRPASPMMGVTVHRNSELTSAHSGARVEENNEHAAEVSWVDY